VLENLINKFFASFASRGGEQSGDGASTTAQ
jgi:hypothetical protein